MKQYILLILFIPFFSHTSEEFILNYTDVKSNSSKEIKDPSLNGWNSQLESNTAFCGMITTLSVGGAFGIYQVIYDNAFFGLYSIFATFIITLGALYAPIAVTKVQRRCKKKKKQF